MARTRAPRASKTGSVCQGIYDLEVSLTCGTAAAKPSASASWSELAPFAPYRKTLTTVAVVNQQVVDSDSHGPFSGEPLVEVQAMTRVFFDTGSQADIQGSAYLHVTNGCSEDRMLTSGDTCHF